MYIQGHHLGVQSWCLRALKTHDELVAALNTCGLDAIELCPVHLDPGDTAAVDAALRLYRDNGITVTSFGVCDFVNDEAIARPIFELARKAGFPALSASPEPDAINLLERLCDEHGVKLALHNHGKSDRYGSPRALADLFAVTSPHFGLCLDTGCMLDVGGDPAAVIERFADRMYGIHIKDLSFHADGSCEDAITGTGDVDVPGVLGALAQIGFQGYTTLEYEGDVDNPIPSIQRCLAYLKSLDAR